jgi:hypothetical protein
MQNISCSTQSEPKQKSILGSKTSIPVSNKTSLNSNVLESLVISLDWLNNSSLKRNYNFNSPINNNSSILEKSTRILPSIAEILIYMNNNNNTSINNLPYSINTTLICKNYTVFLEFIYWSLLHFDTTTQTQVLILFTIIYLIFFRFSKILKMIFF